MYNSIPFSNPFFLFTLKEYQNLMALVSESKSELTESILENFSKPILLKVEREFLKLFFDLTKYTPDIDVVEPEFLPLANRILHYFKK